MTDLTLKPRRNGHVVGCMCMGCLNDRKARRRALALALGKAGKRRPTVKQVGRGNAFLLP